VCVCVCACARCHRKNTDGRMWSEILAENARKEFEQARHERDPEMISRMLVVGRDALNQTMEKVTYFIPTVDFDLNTMVRIMFCWCRPLI
jgi:hypothetical protein